MVAPRAIAFAWEPLSFLSLKANWWGDWQSEGKGVSRARSLRAYFSPVANAVSERQSRRSGPACILVRDRILLCENIIRSYYSYVCSLCLLFSTRSVSFSRRRITSPRNFFADKTDRSKWKREWRRNRDFIVHRISCASKRSIDRQIGRVSSTWLFEKTTFFDLKRRGNLDFHRSEMTSFRYRNNEKWQSWNRFKAVKKIEPFTCYCRIERSDLYRKESSRD